MLVQLFHCVTYPIEELLELFVHPVWEANFGVSIMACIVTGILMLIVIKALVNSSDVGSSIARTSNIRYSQSQRASKSDNKK